MATIQARVLPTASLSSVATFSGRSTRTNVQCQAWGRPSARRNLSIRAEVSTAPGEGGTQAPLANTTTPSPIEQKGVDKADRVAYVCSVCGYIYDLDTPFEEQDLNYQCPVCSASKDQFDTTNATLGQGVFDVTKGEDAKA